MNRWYPYRHRARSETPSPASNRRTIRPGSSRRLILGLAVAALSAIAVWAIASHGEGQAVGHAAAKDTSVLRSLTPGQRQYVTGIASLSPARLHGAFGTDRVSSVDSALASLTPEHQSHVRAISSLSYERLAAAFGTGQ
jgi:hypothetical protein